MEGNSGLRIPGTRNPFEVLARAIVGQQIQVRGAITVMGKVVRDFGEIADGQTLFPRPESLAGLVPGDRGVPTPECIFARWAIENTETK